jgi:hypothetical protein
LDDVTTREIKRRRTFAIISVRVSKGHDDQIADLDAAHVFADGLDAADRFVTHGSPGYDRLKLLVGPKVAATDASCRDGDHRVGGLDETRVRYLLDSNVAGSIHKSCTHDEMSPRNE